LNWDVPDGSLVRLHFDKRWQHVCPWYLAATASWAMQLRSRGCAFEVVNGNHKSAAYMWRMRLHEYLDVNPENLPTEHEETGRFIALRTVRNQAEMDSASEDILPLVHGVGREDWLGAQRRAHTVGREMLELASR
jgi:hypothetical protein